MKARLIRSLWVLGLALLGCSNPFPNISSFTASDTLLGDGGGSVTLSWNVSGAESLSIDQGIGIVTGNSKTVTITKTTAFTLTATNAAGSSTATVRVTVTALGIQDWIKQLGTSPVGVAIDGSGNVFVAGATWVAIAGTNAGSVDTFLIKYDPNGNELWQRQLGTSGGDNPTAVASDSSGNVVITGTTNGAIIGTNAGYTDAFLVKYDPNGNEMWRKQLGTNAADESCGVATDSSGNVFMAGTLGYLFATDPTTFTTFLVKYDPNGNELWRQQPGTNGFERAKGVATDSSGNALITGYVYSGTSPGGSDAVLIKFDPGGNELWRKQLGASFRDEAWGVATDGNGNVFMAGLTSGAITGSNAGCEDAFLVKYDPKGNELWRRQLGTSRCDIARAVASDSSGDVFLAGNTGGAIVGTNAGKEDAFIVAYDPNGQEFWRRQLGTSEDDWFLDIATDSNRNVVFVVGVTLSGINTGRVDAFLVRYR